MINVNSIPKDLLQGKLEINLYTGDEKATQSV
jgi:hypothetical protein